MNKDHETVIDISKASSELGKQLADIIRAEVHAAMKELTEVARADNAAMCNATIDVCCVTVAGEMLQSRLARDLRLYLAESARGTVN